MSHTVVLELPDEVFQPLSRSAEQIGSTPEKLAVEWLSSVSRRSTFDPLEQCIGAIDSSVSDWGDEHDRHLGESLANELLDSEREN